MRRFIAAAVPLALALACTSGSKDQPGPSAQEPGGKGRQGGYVVLPSAEPPYLNPVRQSAVDVATPLVFEGLVGVDARLEHVPVLATKWERSPDGKTLTFQLRKGVSWHDGRPFTAADVLFTLEAIRKPGVTNIWRGYLSSVDKVEAPDDHTVKVTFSETYGPDVAAFTFGILPKHLYDGKDVATASANFTPVGRDIRGDRRDLLGDRRDLRQDVRSGAGPGQLAKDRRDIRQDRRDLRKDHRDLRHDRQDRREDRRDLQHDVAGNRGPGH